MPGCTEELLLTGYLTTQVRTIGCTEELLLTGYLTTQVRNLLNVWSSLLRAGHANIFQRCGKRHRKNDNFAILKTKHWTIPFHPVYMWPWWSIFSKEKEVKILVMLSHYRLFGKGRIHLYSKYKVYLYSSPLTPNTDKVRVHYERKIMNI